eukprot:scaffold14780_cov72-Phaeocystis_antarctica.AAC.6
MIEPRSLAHATSCSSCSRVAAAPVGLFGEQKYTTSARSAFSRSGKKPFSGPHFMYTMPSYCLLASSMVFVWPIMTEVSTYTGYDGSCTADFTSLPNIICSRPMSHLEPSDTKTSSGLMRPPYRASEILARSAPTPCSAPYPVYVSLAPRLFTPFLSPVRMCSGTGSVVSPMPRLMILASGFSARKALRRLPISGKR